MTAPDPGLAAERTLLGWQRTAFGLLGAAALLLRFSARESVLLPGAAVAAGGLLAAFLAWRYSRRDRSDGGDLGSAGPPRLLSLAVTALAAASAVTVVIGLR